MLRFSLFLTSYTVKSIYTKSVHLLNRPLLYDTLNCEDTSYTDHAFLCIVSQFKSMISCMRSIVLCVWRTIHRHTYCSDLYNLNKNLDPQTMLAPPKLENKGMLRLRNKNVKICCLLFCRLIIVVLIIHRHTIATI